MIGALYVVTDAQAPLPVPDQVRAAAKGGARIIQIRDKTASDAEIAALLRAILPEMEAMGVCLIVNDRVEVARVTGAHGLHIGQGDGDPLAIRRRLPPGMILGLSVETEDQARLVPACVDYAGVGPVRATASKPDHAAPIGLAGLARITALLPMPSYAIGGIKQGDAASLRAAGAVGMAVVSAVTRAPDPVAATRALIAEWNAT